MGLQKSENQEKMDNKDVIHYFVGCLTNHTKNTYRMYDPKIGEITITGELKKVPNEVKFEKIKFDNEADDAPENKKI